MLKCNFQDQANENINPAMVNEVDSLQQVAEKHLVRYLNNVLCMEEVHFLANYPFMDDRFSLSQTLFWII